MSSRKQQYEPIKVSRHLQLLSSLCRSILANNLLLSWQNCRVCICAEAAAMPTLQNTGHLKNSPTEKKYSHRRYGLFLILFIKAAIMPAEEWSTHWLFGRFPERKAVSPAFNLEVHFLTIPSWLIIAGDKKTAQTSSVWLQHSLLFYVYFFFLKEEILFAFFQSGGYTSWWNIVIPFSLALGMKVPWRRAGGYKQSA